MLSIDFKSPGYTLIVYLIGSALTGPSFAQETDAIEVLDKIVVTATKREEPTLEIPISVSVFSAEELNELGFLQSGDIAQQTPNLQWRSNFGFSSPNIFLRGIGNNSFHTNAIGPVGIYHDGVYLGSNIITGFPLFDLSRVEVLRGPQGTLFGRNTTGGLIQFISRQPKLEDPFNTRLELTYGSFDQIDVEAAVGFPLGESVAARLALISLNRDGIFDNINPESGFDEAGETDALAYRALLRVQATDNLDFLLNVHGGEQKPDVRPRKQVGVLCPAGTRPGLGSACTDLLGQRDSPNFHDSLENLRTRQAVESYGTNLQISWDLGSITITSLSAFDHADLERLVDGDHQPSAQVHPSYDSEVDFWSQEFTVASNMTIPTQWITGFYYYQDRLNQWEAFDTNDLFNIINPGSGALFRIPLPEGIASDVQQETRSFALFGEFTHVFQERWKLSGGARLTYDQRKVDIESLVWDATTTRNQFVSEETARSLRLFNPIPLTRVENDWLEPSGRLALSYEIDADQLLFASAARGFKGGEYNGGALFNRAEATLTDPEFVTSVELGYKANLLAERLQFSATAFYMDIDDQQVFVLASQGLPLQALVNAGGSEITGFEAELRLLVSDALFFQFGLAYLDARFTEFNDPLDPGTDLSGNRLPEAPKWHLNGLVQYDWFFTPGIVRAQTDFFWNSKRFFTADNNSNLIQEAYGVVNGRLAFISYDNKYQVALWVKNILDEDYFTAGGELEVFGWNVLAVGDPRTVGVTFAVNFN